MNAARSPHDPTRLESHFAFGKNWEAFAQSLDASRLETAKGELVALLGRPSFDGERWIDIGCGSGIHAVAAASLGATVLAVDIDPISVSTTIQVAERFGMSDRVSTRVTSVFDLEGSTQRFDVVYSWGVLHHTGDMESAVRIASALVDNGPDSDLVLALYRRTRLCGFWGREKRWYTSARPQVQLLAQGVFSGLYGLSFLVRGRSFASFKRDYQSRRGMDFRTDVHDWLGGYPYESIVHDEFVSEMSALGFRVEHQVVRYPGRTPSGLFGSGCDEYVFRRDS